MTFKSDFEKIKCENLAYNIASKINISKSVYDAFCNTPREIFFPIAGKAYELDAMPIDGGQWISSLLTVAKMTMALEIDNADSVLEIGCGSGYQAALLSAIVRRVYTIERIESLAKLAEDRFKQIDANVTIKYGDGMLGWITFAPFDRILLSAFTSDIPKVLFDQLNDGGVLVAPIGNAKSQNIVRFRKNGSNITSEVLDSCVFVPILSGKA